MTTTRNQNRLTDQDREAIRLRMADVKAGWISSQSGSYRPSWDHVDSLERQGWSAVGCSQVDLRDSELAEIHEIAVEVSGIETR